MPWRGGQTACLLSKSGFQVTMIEIQKESVDHARELMKRHHTEWIVKQGDFYNIKLKEKFDIITYFDSFGIGSDTDQIRLLCRINEWLSKDGTALIEIGNKTFWREIAHGKSFNLGPAIRTYDYDFDRDILLDTWTLNAPGRERNIQKLRCYLAEEIDILLSKSGLRAVAYLPAGRIDFDKEVFMLDADMSNCMTFYTLIKKDKCTEY